MTPFYRSSAWDDIPYVSICLRISSRTSASHKVWTDPSIGEAKCGVSRLHVPVFPRVVTKVPESLIDCTFFCFNRLPLCNPVSVHIRSVPCNTRADTSDILVTFQGTYCHIGPVPNPKSQNAWACHVPPHELHELIRSGSPQEHCLTFQGNLHHFSRKSSPPCVSSLSSLPRRSLGMILPTLVIYESNVRAFANELKKGHSARWEAVVPDWSSSQAQLPSYVLSAF